MCNDLNPNWGGDYMYTCSCAYDSATTEHESTVLATCGATELVVDGVAIYTSYDVPSWLSTDLQRRRHLCKVSTGSAECVMHADHAAHDHGCSHGCSTITGMAQCDNCAGCAVLNGVCTTAPPPPPPVVGR